MKCEKKRAAIYTVESYILGVISYEENLHPRKIIFRRIAIGHPYDICAQYLDDAQVF